LLGFGAADARPATAEALVTLEGLALVADKKGRADLLLTAGFVVCVDLATRAIDINPADPTRLF
jgi:hypothetical protein